VSESIGLEQPFWGFVGGGHALHYIDHTWGGKVLTRCGYFAHELPPPPAWMFRVKACYWCERRGAPVEQLKEAQRWG